MGAGDDERGGLCVEPERYFGAAAQAASPPIRRTTSPTCRRYLIWVEIISGVEVARRVGVAPWGVDAGGVPYQFRYEW